MNFIEKFQKIFNQCDKHIIRIDSACSKMQPFMPLNEKSYIKLDDDSTEHIDQFLFRFAKLQDAMGQQLFRNVLLFLEEDANTLPFIDILNRLEKLNLIKANQWRELREIRNELSHKYDDDALEMSKAINTIFDKKEQIKTTYKNIKSFIQKRLS